MSEMFDWYVGIDWASEVHQVCLVDDRGAVRGERAVRHNGEELAALAAWLIEITGAAPERIAVGIELPHGPVVESVIERGFAVHSLNPKQLDRFRDRFSVSGAKDERRDARVLGDSLRTDTRCFRRLKPDEPRLIELREQLRMTEECKHERIRLTNRMREQLWRYYPQMLDLSDDLSAAWFLDLWALAPTPAKALRVRESTIAKLLKKHRVRRFDAAEVMRRLRRPALTVAPGTVEAARVHVSALRDRLRLVTRQIAAAERRVDRILTELAASPEEPEAAPGQPPQQSDVTILRSLPGVGRIVCATLLVEAGGPLKAGDHQALRALSGVAPVTRRSGKSCIVLMRQACSQRLRDAVYHWSRVAVQCDATCKARYQALRKAGHTHGRALRTVGDRLLEIACAMMRSRSLYDPQRTVRELQAA